MKKNEFLHEIVAAFEAIPFREVNELRLFQQKLDLFLKSLGGNTLTYRSQLRTIRFSPWSTHAGEIDYKRSWEQGKKETLSILQQIAEDPTVLIIPGKSQSFNSLSIPEESKTVATNESIINDTSSEENAPSDISIELSATQDFSQNQLTENPQELSFKKESLHDLKFSQPIDEPPKHNLWHKIINLFSRKKESPTPVSLEANFVHANLSDKKPEEAAPPSTPEALPQSDSNLPNDATSLSQDAPQIKEFTIEQVTETPKEETALPVPEHEISQPTATAQTNPEPGEAPPSEATATASNSQPPEATIAPPTPETLPVESAAPEIAEPTSTPGTTEPILPLSPETEPTPTPETKDDFTIIKTTPAAIRNRNQVLLVYGSDLEMRDKVAKKIQTFGLEPVFWYEGENTSRSLLEKLKEYSEVKLTIILLSFDEYYYGKDQKPKDARLRSRQKVVFDFAFLLGKFGRAKVMIIHQEKKNLELPTPYFEAFYTPFDKAKAWEAELKQKLETLGYTLKIK